MKKISSRFFLISLMFVVGLGYYGIFRNNKVLSYKMQLSVQRLYVDTKYYHEFKENILGRYTYFDFLFSFKPLKSKYWFTEEEVEKYELERVDEASEFRL